MKANELMVGDYVMVNDIEHTHPLQVTELFMKSGTLYATLYWDGMPEDAMPETLNADVDKVLPIPLTPEILEKNGFEHKHQNEPEKRQYWLLKHDGAEVKAKVNRGKFYFEITGISKAFGLFCPSFSAHLDYLNELQHALRLCGIEKEIEL